MSNLLKDLAYSFGVRSFKSGGKCIPASDSAFLVTCLTGCQVGEGIPFLKSWIKGWTDANLDRV